MIELSTTCIENITPFPYFTFVREQFFSKKNCSQNDEFTIHIWNENPIDISGKIILYLAIFREKAIVTKKKKGPWMLPRINKNRTNEGIGILIVINLDITRTGIYF